MRLFRRQTKTPQVLAAVDLGSNSFHMIVARLSHGQPKVIDRLREMVRLAGGLSKNQLSPEREELALACLSRFGERLREFKADSVRVVGTNTLRKLGQNSGFVTKANECLGHPIEIISGMEEARLIYQGVVHSSPPEDGRQIVVDIGGGSTEIIRGEGQVAEAMESLDIGCVGLTRQFMADGRLTKRRFKKARLAARLELAPIRQKIAKHSADRVSGASGTIRAAHSVLARMFPEPVQITPARLQELIDLMIKIGHVDALEIDGLSAQRAPVFPAGVCVLIEVMEVLGLESMRLADGALREGLLYDMLGRLSAEDARDVTVRSMEGRFNIDVAQADRVESTAAGLLEQVAVKWKLDDERDFKMLSWAARLHEVGLHIAHSRYHAHGAYLLENADMPGFPTIEQQVLAKIIGEHRGKISRRTFDDIPALWKRSASRLTVLLRLAVLINRSRSDSPGPEIQLRAKGRTIVIDIPAAEIIDNPLTWADLNREARYLKSAGYELTLPPDPDEDNGT